MSDITVTVQTVPVLVTARNSSPVTIVNGLGIQGPVQDLSSYLTSGQADNFLLTTGEGDARYYPLGSNPSGYLTSATLGGVNHVNGLVGDIVFTGQGGIIIYTSGQYIQVSGGVTSNFSGYITTGQADLRYLNTGVSGFWYPYSNPSSFSTSGNVANTGASLQSQINSLSGNIITTGQTLDNKINNLSGWVNSTSRVSSINVTGFGNQTGIINLSGLGGLVVSTGAGNFIYFSGSATASADHGDGINLSGNLGSTGSTLYNDIVGLSGTLNNSLFVHTTGNEIINGLKVFSGALFSGYFSGINLTGFNIVALNTLLSSKTTSSPLLISSMIVPLTGNNKINMESGFLIWPALGDKISVDWYNHLLYDSTINNGISIDWGNRILSGNWDISYLTMSGNVVTTFSNYLSLSGNLGSTGSVLYNDIIGLSGVHNNTPKVSGISVTGSFGLTGNINFSGLGGLVVSTGAGNFIYFSGGAGGGGTTINNYAINSGSGIFIFRSGIQSGVSSQFINFPTSLDIRPIVLATIHNDISDLTLFGQVSGSNSTGFWILLSDTTNNTGYYLDIFASNSAQTGMATNVIVNNITNNYTSNSDGVNLSGNLYLTGSNLYNLINNLSGAFTGSYLKYNTFATSGVETEFVNYPLIMPSKPIIELTLENNRDLLMYGLTMSGVNTTGFYANYSDYLSTSGYKLHITLSI
jgi:hypothetical protein